MPHQWSFSKKNWRLNGETTLKPKNEGEGVVMSAFVRDAHGFEGGVNFPTDLLVTITMTIDKARSVRAALR